MNKYILTGNGAEDYIKALHQQASSLSDVAIRDGVDEIAKQMKKDILNTPDTLDVSGKTVYYLSEKNGNDDNDGLSKDKPLKTIAALSKYHPIHDAAILFERGGIYRGTFVFTPHTYYGAYGDPTMPKPLIMQSKRNYADPSLWVETEYPNVYRCTELFCNAGVIGFDHDLFDYSEKCYDELYGEVEGIGENGFTGVQDLNKDLQFYSVIPGKPSYMELKKGIPGDLYVYSAKGNPGERFKSIEIGERTAIFGGDPVENIIENLAMKFTGAHAVATDSMEGLTVRGCVISWVGGSVLSIDYLGCGSPARYGNAIEGQNCDRFVCENNWVYQIYDTGLTHQRGVCDETVILKNLSYTCNLVEYCHWSFEFYNDSRGKTEGRYSLIENQHIAYNLCRFTGYGWGSIVSERWKESQAYNGSSCGITKNIVTEYTIFDRSAGYLLNVVPGFNINESNNIYIQHLGNTLGYLNGNYHKCDEKTPEYIVSEWKDENGIVILVDPEKEPTDILFK